ncbi:hypothetical protein PTI98_003017 [Pleurotus ostreatus]|nr:hypothetical protein PTI98_003017 [Pleurotus ostreatus]
MLTLPFALSFDEDAVVIAEAAVEVEGMDVAEVEVVVEDDDGFEFGALQLIERFISEGRRIRYGPYNPIINIGYIGRVEKE